MINPTIAPIANFGLTDEAKPKDTGGSFGNILKDVMGEWVNQQKQAETVSNQAVAGKANLVDVMTGVTNAETSLQMIIAVRDRFVQAYQEILRMPV